MSRRADVGRTPSAPPRAIALAMALSVASATAPATAGDALTSRLFPSVDSCQPALPAFDGAFRKRPLAMQNESAAAAFLTCGTGSIRSLETRTTIVQLLLINLGASAVAVSCTLVDGVGGLVTPIYVTKLVAVPGGGGATPITWSAAADNNDVRFMMPVVSCNLPGSVGVSVVAIEFDPPA